MAAPLIGQLAASLAHEVATPIQFVGDGLDFAREAVTRMAAVIAAYRQHHAALPPDAQRAIDAVLAEVDLDYYLDEAPPAIAACVAGVSHIAEVIRTVRSAAHPSRPPPEPVALAPLVARAITWAGPRLAGRADVAVAIPPTLPAAAGYPAELERVFVNLLTNASDAIAAHHGHGRIDVRAAASATAVTVEIADTGGGIPPAIRARVFEPYVTTKSIGHGSGLGLALAHAIVVDLHHGQLGFRCDEVGTTFVVTLPRAPAPQP
ncbi:MAG: HAMP domain-containing histidine kinase [Myxococcales bacterium]|nr:HAMP domain-containing histidine kinase [Myxococcales bacterium]MBK7198038.1 HAMP domain-containing histidine kinase [Myxococcales bacterium]MBP6844751.1 HAMP domain-containing histidine kinase [Kofleriaceae bacterium]